MKYMEQLGEYRASNVRFSPETEEATSYDWWTFVRRIDGSLVFNEYPYSPTTMRHQAKVRSLLQDLGLSVDITVSFRDSLSGFSSLEELAARHEKAEIARITEQELKRIQRLEKAQARRFEKKVEALLEEHYEFRDYTLRRVEDFSLFSGSRPAMHQIVSAESFKKDIGDAIDTYYRDGFSHIVFYLDPKNTQKQGAENEENN